MPCPTNTQEFIFNSIRDNQNLQDTNLFLCVICILGCTTVLVAILRSRPFTPHLLLVSTLTFADLLLGIQAIIFFLYYNQQPGLVQTCQVGTLFSTFGVLVSLISFGMISIERYLVICHGLQNHTKMTVIAIILTISYAFMTGLISASSPEYIDIGGYVLCHPKYCSRSLAMVFVNISFVIVLSLFMISAVYCPYQILQIYTDKTTTGGDSILVAENKHADYERKIRERKVFFKLSIVTAFFIVMLGPLALALVYEVLTGNVTPPALAGVYGILVALNSALNPFLLYAFDISVKSRINQLLGIRSILTTTSSPKHSRLTPIKLLSTNSNLKNGKQFNVKDTSSLNVKDTVKM
jgi:hypothetical protein